MSKIESLSFKDNTAISSSLDRYTTLVLDVEKTLKSWRESLFSYEWLNGDGQIKARDDLPEKEQSKRDEVERLLDQGGVLEQPVVGIGILENIEFGIGRATFLTLASYGMKEMPVHVLKINEDEFKDFVVGS